LVVGMIEINVIIFISTLQVHFKYINTFIVTFLIILSVLMMDVPHNNRISYNCVLNTSYIHLLLYAISHFLINFSHFSQFTSREIFRALGWVTRRQDRQPLIPGLGSTCGMSDIPQ
jgi:hypothetical protein